MSEEEITGRLKIALRCSNFCKFNGHFSTMAYLQICQKRDHSKICRVTFSLSGEILQKIFEEKWWKMSSFHVYRFFTLASSPLLQLASLSASFSLWF
jgi:hypothetical protein